MWRRLDVHARRIGVVPILLLGIALSHCSEWLIRLGAWIADIDSEA